MCARWTIVSLFGVVVLCVGDVVRCGWLGCVGVGGGGGGGGKSACVHAHVPVCDHEGVKGEVIVQNHEMCGI